MRTVFIVVFLSILMVTAQPSQAQTLDEFDLGDYKWKDRVLLVFSPNTYNPDYRGQVKALKNKQAGIQERDLKIFYVLRESSASVKGAVIEDDAADRLRSEYDISSNNYVVLLIGKDGTEKLRSEETLSAEDLFDEIDDMPMRKLEMKDGK